MVVHPGPSRVLTTMLPRTWFIQPTARDFPHLSSWANSPLSVACHRAFHRAVLPRPSLLPHTALSSWQCPTPTTEDEWLPLHLSMMIMCCTLARDVFDDPLLHLHQIAVHHYVDLIFPFTDALASFPPEWSLYVLSFIISLSDTFVHQSLLKGPGSSRLAGKRC